MAAAQCPSLIQDYTTLVTSLQNGKVSLIDCGIDRVMLNRYIVDAATTTDHLDHDFLLDTINLDKVEYGGNNEDKRKHCGETLAELVKLQEEITTLQKVARENGISGGLLTVVGQAARQSPDDHGASVIRQLHLLMNDDAADSSVVPSQATSTESVPDTFAANDAASGEFERLSSLQQLVVLMRENWKPLAIDSAICLVMTCLAINLVR